MGSIPKSNGGGDSKVEFFINLYEASPPAGEPPSPMPICTIELHMRHRYQLRIPSNEGVMILVEDILTPEWRTSSKLPLLSSVSLWRELYMPGLFAGLNLDPDLLASLRSKVADAASSLLAASAGTKSSSFAIVAKVGVLQNEILSEEETGRIAADFANSPPSPPPDPPTDDS